MCQWRRTVFRQVTVEMVPVVQSTHAIPPQPTPITDSHQTLADHRLTPTAGVSGGGLSTRSAPAVASVLHHTSGSDEIG